MSSRQNVFPDSVSLQTAQQDCNFPEQFSEEDIIGWPDTSTILDVEVNEGSVAYYMSSTNVEPTPKDDSKENSSQKQNWFSGSVASIFIFIHSASYHQSRSLHLDISIDLRTYPSAGLSAYFCRISSSPLILSTHTLSVCLSLSLSLSLSASLFLCHSLAMSRNT